MEFIRVAPDGWGFEEAQSKTPFVPIGCNYAAVIQGIENGGYCGQVFSLFGRDGHTLADPIQEAERAFERLADLNLNVVRLWLEPDTFFPLGLRLDPDGAGLFEDLLDVSQTHGLRLSVGMHIRPHASRVGSNARAFEPPHRERLNEQLYLLARRWGREAGILSWTIVGEGTLPWQTRWIESQWPAWLEYWYDGDLKGLQSAWGEGVRVDSFLDAPVPPRNVGATLPLGALAPGRLDDLPFDRFAGSTWRYDWRLFLEEIGAAWIHEQCRTLRGAGAGQMITVGNNPWTFPGLAAGQMALGFNPYFYLDSVDYLCQHNYPAPQCLPGGNGDPLSGAEALSFWLHACEVMGRIYGSMGKPVVLEEWGWYGGGESAFLNALPFRSEGEQRDFCDAMMESTQSCFSGWLYWQWRDMPGSSDITNLSSLYGVDGQRLKEWGRSYGQWAARLRENPPQRAPAKKRVELPMKSLLTDDLFHERWWQDTVRESQSQGPLDFKPVFERKPLTDTNLDLRDQAAGRSAAIEMPMGRAQLQTAETL